MKHAKKELRHLREFGVCGKVDERAAVAKHNVTPSIQSGSTLTKHSRRSRCKSVHDCVAREFKGGEARLACGDSLRWMSSESCHIHCCGSQSMSSH